jgi:RNA polymerase sigma factor (sigma-70 family)
MADPSKGDLRELVRQAQPGSNDAAAEVCERCRAPLTAVIRSLLDKPSRKILDVDDLLNETFAEIFTSKFSEQVFESSDTLLQYMKAIARNNVCDATRKYLHSERFSVRAEAPLDAAQAECANELSPADCLMLAEFIELTDTDLGEHPRVSAALNTKYVFCGYSVPEIATLLNTSQRNVQHLIERAKQQLSGGINGEDRLKP